MKNNLFIHITLLLVLATYSKISSGQQQTDSIIHKRHPFELNFSTFEKFFLRPHQTPTTIRMSLSRAYVYKGVTESPQAINETEGEWEWKFQDDTKSWKAIIYLQYDDFGNGTTRVKEMQFTAPDTKVAEYRDELKSLGYTYLGKEGAKEVYQNNAKHLGAKIVYAENMFHEPLYLMRLFIQN